MKICAALPEHEPYSRAKYEREKASTLAYEVVEECIEKAVGWAALHHHAMKRLEWESLNPVSYTHLTLPTN